jgi:hypothetical protein
MLPGALTAAAGLFLLLAVIGQRMRSRHRRRSNQG